MGRQLIGRRWSSRRVKMSASRRPASVSPNSSQRGSSCAGLDDTPCEENSTVKERLDLGWLDAVLPILGAVAGIPVELACHSGDAGEPLVKAAVWRNLH